MYPATLRVRELEAAMDVMTKLAVATLIKTSSEVTSATAMSIVDRHRAEASYLANEALTFILETRNSILNAMRIGATYMIPIRLLDMNPAIITVISLFRGKHAYVISAIRNISINGYRTVFATSRVKPFFRIDSAMAGLKE